MNKVDSIFLQRYKRLNGYQIKNELIKFFEDNDAPLTDKQRSVLQDACDGGFYSDMWLPFQAYERQKNVSETSNGQPTAFDICWSDGDSDNNEDTRKITDEVHFDVTQEENV